MDKRDELALLFEATNGPDANLTRRKIDEIRRSKEYRRLSRLAPSLSYTPTTRALIEKFTAIDIYAARSYEEALEFETEIKEVDLKLKETPTFNPFFEEGAVKEYKVKNVGDLKAEINGEVVTLKDVAANRAVLSSVRKKTLKLQIIAWFKQASAALTALNKVNHELYRKIRDIKLRFASLEIIFGVTVIGVVIFFLDLILSDYQWYRLNGDNLFYNILIAFILLGSSFIVCVHRYYRTYPQRLLRKVKRQMTRSDEALKDLNAYYDAATQEATALSQTPQDLNLAMKDLAFFRKEDYIGANLLRDYAYNPREYFRDGHKALLTIYHLVFALTLAAIVFLLVTLESGYFG